MPINPNPPQVSSGDTIPIQFTPTNSIPATEAHTDNVNQLTAHLKGIDTAVGGKSASNHNHDSSYSATDHTHSYVTAGKSIALSIVFGG